MSSLESHRLSVGGGLIGSGWAYSRTDTMKAKEDSDESTTPIGGRVYHFLRRQLKAPWARFATVTDPRDRRGQRWSLLPMMHTILAGILAG